MLVPLALTLIGIAGIATVVLIPVFQAIALSTRQLTNTYRAALGTITGTSIPVPYAPAPPQEDPRHPWSAKSLQRVRWLLEDPATWQDLVWMLLNPVICALTVLLPGLLALYSVTVVSFSWLIHPGIGPMFGSWRLLDPTAFLGHYAWLGLPAGLVVAAWLLTTAPNNLKGLYRFSAALLAPARDVPISEQVADLTSAQEAELRRIERDLHDGAQARMVAVGMTLRTVERLLDTKPEAVRELIVEARETSAAALRDLRTLVRGIHPPILAERGLTDALRAVALQTPLAVTCTSTCPSRSNHRSRRPSTSRSANCSPTRPSTRDAEHASLTLRRDARRDYRDRW